MREMPRAVAALAFFAASALACAHAVYVLPEPDSTVKASPPTLVGEILAVSADQLTIQPEGPRTTAAVRVTINSETLAYTDLGGWVKLADLKTGDRVRVWRTPEDMPTRVGFRAARIMVDTSSNPTKRTEGFQTPIAT
jgi:hypothetical protein